MRRLLTYLLCCSLLPLHAQLGQPLVVDTLSAVEIMGTRLRPIDAHHIDSISISDGNGLLDASELLSYHSVLYIRSNGPGGSATVASRGGASSHTLVLWNGVPLNSPTLGTTDLSMLPLPLATAAAVYTTSGSRTFGSGGLGGAIDVSTGVSDQPGLRFTNTYETATTAQMRSLGHTTHGKRLDMSVNVYHQKADNDFFSTRQTSTGPVAERRVNAAFSSFGAGHSGRYVHDNAVSEWNVDYLILDRELPTIIGVPDRGETQYDRALRTRYAYRQGHTMIGLSHIADRQEYTDPLSAYAAEYTSGQSRLSIDHALYEESSNYLKLRGEVDHIEASVGQGQALHRRQVVSAVAQHRVHRASGLVLDTDLRASMLDGVMTPLTGGLTLAYRGTDSGCWDAHLSLGRVFRAATFNDLYWPGAGDEGLLPELGLSSEFGLGYKVGGAEVTLDIYGQQMDRLISWRPTDNGPWRPLNINDVISFGGQWTYSQQVEQLIIEASYSYTHTEVEREGQAIRMPYSPDHIAQLSLRSQRKGLIEPVMIGRYSSGAFTSEANTTRTEGFVDFTLGAQFRLDKSERCHFTIQVVDLFDAQYEIVRGRPQAGRRSRFTLTYTLDNT